MQADDAESGFGTAGVGQIVRLVLAAVVIGSMMVTFALSLAAIVYSGPLAAHLSEGIAFTLIGAIVMGVVGPLALSYRGAIVQPQDVTAILLSLAAAAIVGRAGLGAEAAFPTVAVMIAAATIATGAAAYAMGSFRLGYLVRFVPLPVVSGFLAASGTLLIAGAFDMLVARGTAGPGEWPVLLAGSWPLWLPWLLVAALITGLLRRTSNGYVIPVALALALTGFYLTAWVLGLDHAAMRELGLLVGPFEGRSFASGLSFGLFAHVDWYVLATQFPLILTIVGMSLLGTLLNASGLELAIGREIDLERDLKGVGLANLGAGLGGGMVGYHVLGETLLARRLGVTGAATGLLVVPACAAALFFGAEVLSYVPVGLFAAVIWYLGFDLMLTAIGDHGRRMPRLDFAIVLVTPLIALAFGFMPAVAFGVLAAAVLFIVAYSGVDVVRLSTTGASFRARIERSPQDMERLAAAGTRVHIHRLGGFLFFGSANQLVERLHRDAADEAPPEIVVVDLARVSGLDMTAWAAFERLARRCRQNGTRLVLTGLSPAFAGRYERWTNGRDRGHIEIAGDLDGVLEGIEERQLRRASAEPARSLRWDADGDDPDGEFAALLRRHGYWMEVAAGDVLLAEGAGSDHLLFLQRGKCRAVVRDRNGADNTVSRFLPGAIIGEIAYYAGVPRTASVVAETPAVVVHVNAAALAQMEREDPAQAARFHRRIATVLARRLTVTTQLLRDTEA